MTDVGDVARHSPFHKKVDTGFISPCQGCEIRRIAGTGFYFMVRECRYESVELGLRTRCGVQVTGGGAVMI